MLTKRIAAAPGARRYPYLSDKANMNSKSLFWVIVPLSAVWLGGCGRDSAQTMDVASGSVAIDLDELTADESQAELSLPEAWGIKIEYAMLSAGGYMVDFRFRVLNVEKAAPIFDRKVMPRMIDQATGAEFIVPSPPKVGPLRSGGNIKEGKVYFIFFANPARYVKSGNKITVLIGDFRLEDVVVN